MKKIYTLAALVAAFMLFSCAKEADLAKEEPASGSEEVNNDANLPDENLPEGMIRLNFAVSAENDAPADPESKTSWDGTAHSWSNGDQVRILWGTGDSDYIDADVVNGAISAVVADVDTYYAVYPTTATYALDLTEGKVTITVPRYQSGNFSDANIMAAKTTKAAASLSFKNMTSILKFTTGSTYAYNSASFMANDKSVKLTGEVATTFSDEFAVTTSNEVMKEDIICIQPNNPEGNAGMTANTTYYLAMLPGAAIDNGIGFKIETRAGSSVDLVAGGLSRSAFNRERSKVYDLGTLDSRIVANWFITESGRGTKKGNNWENAGDVARLLELLSPSYSANGTTAAWRLTNANIIVAAGTYNLQAANSGVLTPTWDAGNAKITIKGGYADGGSTQDPDVNITAFVNNESANNDRIFRFQNKNVRTLTFDGITFTTNNGTNHNSRGQIMYVDGSTSGELNFVNCRFKDMQSSNAFGAPCLDFNASGELKVNFTQCAFTGNSCTNNTSYGGAVLLESGASTQLSFENCLFDSNSATGSKGGGALFLRDGETTINGCTFSGNSATNGAAIYSLGAGATNISKVLAFNCTFDDNDASSTTNGNGSGGAIYLGSYTRSMFANSTFTNTSASNDQGVFTLPSTTSNQHPYLYLVSCTMSGNSYDITRNLYTVFIYNSILTSDSGAKSNHFKKYSIINKTVYQDDAARATDATLSAIPLQSLSNGVFPLDGNFSSYYDAGMSVTDLQGLSFTTLPANSGKNNNKGDSNAPEGAGAVTLTLTQDQIDLLANDQKGNLRNGTIMGAYVLTTAPSN